MLSTILFTRSLIVHSFYLISIATGRRNELLKAITLLHHIYVTHPEEAIARHFLPVRLVFVLCAVVGCNGFLYRHNCLILPCLRYPHRLYLATHNGSAC